MDAGPGGGGRGEEEVRKPPNQSISGSWVRAEQESASSRLLPRPPLSPSYTITQYYVTDVSTTYFVL